MYSKEKAFEKQVLEPVSALVRTGIAELLNPAKEDHCVQELDDQGLVDSFLTDVGDINSELKDESNDEKNVQPPLKEQLYMLAFAKRIFVSSGYVDAVASKEVRKMQSSVHTGTSKDQKQTKIDSFFK